MMIDLSNIDDECSVAWTQSTDNIDEWRLLSYEANQQNNVEEDANPIN